ncbi:MAG: flagellar assembly protein FliW [Melioribacteraceae bacterium]|nr:flagellar assembly protein FliW [Melioribacteraceae bacterium]
MKIQTKQFGEIEFDENLIIKFDAGIFGFEEYSKYLLIKTDNELFYWLNSVEEPEVAFPLIGIRILDDEYPFEDNGEPFGIVTLNSDPSKITVNLKAPIYINQDKKVGEQRILDNDKYSVDYNLFID